MSKPTPSWESSKQIEAIPTTYAGVEFKSRLEARWALFFDALRIQWEYEPERVRVPDVYYYPDFLLVDIPIITPAKKLYGLELKADDLVAEIKPARPLTADEIAKCGQYIYARTLLMLQGSPANYTCTLYTRKLDQYIAINARWGRVVARGKNEIGLYMLKQSNQSNERRLWAGYPETWLKAVADACLNYSIRRAQVVASTISFEEEKRVSR